MLKTLHFLFVMLIVSQFLSAQKTVENPKHGIMTDGRIHIRKVQMTDSATILSIHTDWFHNQWLSIPKETYIQPVGSAEKLYVTKADSVPIGDKFLVGETGVKEFVLYFPPIDTSTALLDFGEGNEGGNWFVYDVELKRGSFINPILEPYIGNWFLTDGSKALILGLYEKNVVYNSKVWNYGNIKPTDKQIEIELLRLKEKQLIYLTLPDSGVCRMGISLQYMVEVSNTAKEVAGYKIPGDAPYQLPILKNDSATYCGVIRNFNSRFIQKTGVIYIDNIITGKQESYSIKIADNGAFSITIPLAYPHSAFIRLPYLVGNIFLEPGETTFHLIDLKDWSYRNLYMGDLAQVNDDLLKLNEISYFNYDEMKEKIVDMNPEQYKTYCFDIRGRELAALNDYASTHSISAKAKQVKEYNIRYIASIHVLDYSQNFENAYRKKNNISQEIRKLDIQIPQPDNSFYSFLTNNFVNDILSIISVNYDNFINRVKFIESVRNNSSFTNTPSSIAVLVKETGKILTPEEDEFVSNSAQMEDSIVGKKRSSFSEKFNVTSRSFFGKYRDSIKSNLEDESFILWYDVENVLSAKGITLTPDEKEMIEAAKAIQTREQIQTQKEFNKKNRDIQQTFYNKYQYLIDQKRKRDRKENRDKKMKELFGVEKGFATDIMFAQDVSRSIIEELNPIEINDLKLQLAPITSPFITDYIIKANETTKQKIEANKLKTGYNVNTTPSVEADQLFDSMLAKFKGKVVFVDFWATWCGPCRSGMEQMKPLKEELEGKNIVFVYITNQTSPEETWKNMITDIKGEHFRVKPDEWNILIGKFNISGIPHYVLVDKNGVVAKNDGMDTGNKEGLKKMFEEFMAK